MEVQSSLNSLKESSKELESIFTYLNECFTKLSKNKNTNSIDKLKNTFDSLAQLNLSQTEKEVDLFSELSSKHSNFATSLNDSIKELSNISSQVSELKNISEEMELIALNAMVISIKSGEKGRAFSKITENLKRLSNMMNAHALRLISTEQELLSNITELKNLYNQISSAENNIESISSSVCSTIKEIVSNSSFSLQNIDEQTQKIYQPIKMSKEGLNHQDTINHSLEQIYLLLNQNIQNEIIVTDFNSEMDKQLDTISFEISVFELAKKILSDTNQQLLESTNILKDKWNIVTQTLSKIEDNRKNYISMFIENNSESDNKNFIKKLTELENKHSKITEQFITFQQAQKTICSDCKIVTKKVLSISDIFEQLEPIIAQLHHVRVLQEIEVSKNLAISTVKNFVDDMDKLISNAQTNLEQMEKNVTEFIGNIQSLLKNLTNTVSKNSEQMESLKKVKNEFFEKLFTYKLDISHGINNFTVFPEDFTDNCKTVADKINIIENHINLFNQIIENYKDFICTRENEKQKLLTQYNLTSWDLKNEKLKDILNDFITSTTEKPAEKTETVQIDSIFEVEDFDFF